MASSPSTNIMILKAAFLVSLAALLLLWNSSTPQLGCTGLEKRPIGDVASNSNSNEGAGVGFDLTGSYGTVAISYPNGTIANAAKIEHDDCEELFARLSLASSEHLHPPYDNRRDALRDAPRQLKRRARKFVGLPASDDVGTLSGLITFLKYTAESHLDHHPVTAAIAATPHLIALYAEDLIDAFQYSGLQYLPTPVHSKLVYETGPAYAGCGFGLCSDYKNSTACRVEERNMTFETVSVILYTRTVLTVTFTITCGAYYAYEPPTRRVEDFTLGSNARSKYPNEDDYWERVYTTLRQTMQDKHWPTPRKVLLMGESVHDQSFMMVLEAALRSIGAVELPEVWDEEPVFVAARGAAEMAKRAMYDGENAKLAGDDVDLGEWELDAGSGRLDECTLACLEEEMADIEPLEEL